MSAFDLTDPDALVGLTLAHKYRLKSILGSGAMGTVYEAEQIDLGRSVAIKLVKPHGQSTNQALFRNEALAASRINHPHAVTVFDFGITPEGIPYLIMECLRGGTLAAAIEAAAIDIKRAIAIEAQILSALTEAHACGVVHRDLKTENVILEQLRAGEDHVKVIDFGLARLSERADEIVGIAGTPEFMAPEQINGGDISAATDLYAAGMILYEMIVGRTPFAGRDVQEILHAQLEDTPLPPHQLNSSCPVALSNLVMRAVEKDPSDRHANAQEMRAELLRIAAIDGEVSCDACGTPVSSSQRFCSSCGVALASADEPPPIELELLPPTRSERIEVRGATAFRATIHAVVAQPAAEEPATPEGKVSPCILGRAATPVIGRRSELADLTRFYAGETKASVLAIVGPRGIGKLRTLLEVAGSVQVTTFLAGSDPSGLKRSWYPILSMLESALGLESDPDIDDLQAALARCGLPDRDLPGLAELFSLPGPLQDAELAVRRRESVVAAGRALTLAHRRHAGCVLCFADVDSYDRPSIDFIQGLAADLTLGGTRIIVTLNDDRHAPPEATVLRIEPLNVRDGYAFAQSIASEFVSLPDPAGLHSYTQGSPVMAEQLVGWIGQGNTLASAPSALVDIMSARLSGLPPAARRLLQAIAVHGTSASWALVEATLGDKKPPSPALVTALVQLKFLLSDPSELSLCSELLRDVVRAATPVNLRHTLNDNAIEAYDALALPPSVAVLAYHATEANHLERGYEYALRAGDEAVRHFDDAGGASWYGKALAVATSAGPGANRLFIEASIRIAEVLRCTHQFDLAKEVLEHAALNEPDAMHQAEITRLRGRLAVSEERNEEACRHFRDAIGAALRGNVDRDFLCETYVELARVLAETAHPTEAARELTEAVDLLTLGDAFATDTHIRQLWRLGFRLAELRFKTRAYAEARATALQAIEYCERIGCSLGLGRLYALLARICEEGGLSGATAHRSKAIALLRRMGDRRSTAELLFENARASRNERSSASLATTGAAEDVALSARELASEIGWNVPEPGPMPANGD